METWQKDIITQALDRCWGLRETLKTQDNRIYNGAIHELARQTGMGEEFLRKHITTIQQL